MLFLLIEKIALLILLSYQASAFSGDLRFNSNSTTSTCTYHANNIIVTDKSVTVKLLNSPSIRVRSGTFNKGLLLIQTDDNALSRKNLIKYKFGGHFANVRTLAIIHENRLIPIKVRIASMMKRHFFLFPGGYYSSNLGAIIFLSNGPSMDHDEFVIELPHTFINSGTISIFGTEKHRARLKILAPPNAKWLEKGFRSLPAMQNEGYIFVRRATFRQEASFLDVAGCVALGEGSNLIANNNYTMNLQNIFFQPEEKIALLSIISVNAKTHAKYTVVNFPRGSQIRVDRDFATVNFFDGWVEFFTSDNLIMTIKFEGISMMRSKFRYKNHLLTYDDDALSYLSHKHPCEKIHDVIKQATFTVSKAK